MLSSPIPEPRLEVSEKVGQCPRIPAGSCEVGARDRSEKGFHIIADDLRGDY